MGKFLCLVWQHCCRPWSFTCEARSFGSGITGFVWVRRVWNGSTGPKSHQMQGVFRHMVSQHKRWTFSGNSQTNCCCLWWHYELPKCDEVVPWILRREDWCSRRTRAVGHLWSLDDLLQKIEREIFCTVIFLVQLHELWSYTLREWCDSTLLPSHADLCEFLLKFSEEGRQRSQMAYCSFVRREHQSSLQRLHCTTSSHFASS
jgi:hypothetical protein